MTFFDVLAVELLKLRRCKVTWATLAVFSLAPLGIALFMWIVREPGRAAQLGLLGTKASLVGIEATWPAFFSMLTLIVGVGGMLLLSFIVAYVFGREYDDATAKNLLAVPIGRHQFVLAKFAIALAWWLVLVVAVLAESLAIGALLGLPGFSGNVAAVGIRSALIAALISFLLVPVVGWVTVAGRGYMPPIGFALAMMALGQLFSKTGWAPWFPWSIIPLLIGSVGKPQALPLGSYIVVAFAFAAGIAATIAQLRLADNAQ